MLTTLLLSVALAGSPPPPAEAARAEPVDPLVVGVGFAAGCLSGFCCGPCGVPGCLAAAAYYAKDAPPVPYDVQEQQDAYVAEYQRAMQRRRATWALAGGSAGLVTGMGFVVALTYGPAILAAL